MAARAQKSAERRKRPEAKAADGHKDGNISVSTRALVHRLIKQSRATNSLIVHRPHLPVCHSLLYYVHSSQTQKRAENSQSKDSQFQHLLVATGETWKCLFEKCAGEWQAHLHLLSIFRQTPFRLGAMCRQWASARRLLKWMPSHIHHRRHISNTHISNSKSLKRNETLSRKKKTKNSTSPPGRTDRLCTSDQGAIT